MPVDLSLYLVTDSTPAILKGRDLCTVVEEALKGGKQENAHRPIKNSRLTAAGQVSPWCNTGIKRAIPET